VTTKNIDRVKILNARTATIIFLAVFAAEMVFAILLDGAAGLVTGTDERDATGQNYRTYVLAGKIADSGGPIVGVIVMIALANFLIPNQIKDTSPTGAAWVPGKTIDIGKGMIVGIFAAIFSLVLDLIEQPRLPFSHFTPAEQMGATPGLQQILFLLVAVVVAPPVEEMMFRGIFYGGYRKSFGPAWAAVFTTAIFVAIHFVYFISFPYMIVAVTVSAVAFLWCRLRWNAIGPAIAAHAAYNLLKDIL